MLSTVPISSKVIPLVSRFIVCIRTIRYHRVIIEAEEQGAHDLLRWNRISVWMLGIHNLNICRDIGQETGAHYYLHLDIPLVGGLNCCLCLDITELLNVFLVEFHATTAQVLLDGLGWIV